MGDIPASYVSSLPKGTQIKQKKQATPWASTTMKIMVDPIWMIKTLR